MIYTVGMLCKHFKGKDLIEKNIYRIEKIGVNGSDINPEEIKYAGDNDLESAVNLVVYTNIFQDENNVFCREYDYISGELTDDKKEEFKQTRKVEPLTDDEIAYINIPEFIEKKKEYMKNKYSTQSNQAQKK